MTARDTLTQALMEPTAAPQWMADEWLDAHRAEVLEEAAVAAHAEGDRLYDDTGLKAAEAAWGVANLLRALATAPRES